VPKVNEQVLNLMKKELLRLEKAHEKAKEKTEQIRSAPEKMIALLRKAQAMTQDKTLSAMQLVEKLKSTESENNRLRKLLGMDYCCAIDTEFRLKMEYEDMKNQVWNLEWRLNGGARK
jgi:hypothetical protein